MVRGTEANTFHQCVTINNVRFKIKKSFLQNKLKCQLFSLYGSLFIRLAQPVRFPSCWKSLKPISQVRKIVTQRGPRARSVIWSDSRMGEWERTVWRWSFQWTVLTQSWRRWTTWCQRNQCELRTAYVSYFRMRYTKRKSVSEERGAKSTPSTSAAIVCCISSTIFSWNFSIRSNNCIGGSNGMKTRHNYYQTIVVSMIALSFW